MKVSDISIGSRIFIGKVREPNTTPWVTTAPVIQPVEWIKATKDSMFISEFVVGYLCFDAVEPMNPAPGCSGMGCPNYALSNVRAYLNSRDADWFAPKHAYDKPPRRYTEAERTGFLYLFEDYEVDSLVSDIELPSLDNIFGDNRFPLFKKRGVRPKNRRYPRTYDEFWLSSESNDRYATLVNRRGSADRAMPCSFRGVRPICRVSPDTEIIPASEGMGYVIKPYEIEANKSFSDSEFYEFLGFN